MLEEAHKCVKVRVDGITGVQVAEKSSMRKKLYKACINFNELMSLNVSHSKVNSRTCIVEVEKIGLSFEIFL